MPKDTKDLWLKVLIGFIITVIAIGSTIAFTMLDKLDEKKVEKEVFTQHEKYQQEQFGEIKDSLQRIEDKL